MKRINWLALAFALLLLAGCGDRGARRYEASYLNLFDTVTTITGTADSEEEFQQTAQSLYRQLEDYHRLLDIYEAYPGLTNLNTVNQQAGTAPVPVDRELMDFLLFCQEVATVTDGTVNAAMGSVLSLWHSARADALEDPAQAHLPDRAALEAAAEHMDPAALVLDPEAGTVYFSDPELKLDVGALAKGYAVEQVSKSAPEGYLINVGGNVRATGPKADGSPWVIGLQDPSGDGNLHTLTITDQSVVTSGDYQRYYTVDGVRYHHIIDPETLLPGEKWQAVSVVCGDSGVADALSTALFLLDREEGQTLLEQFDAEALWLDSNGKEYRSPGLEALLRD